MTAYQPKVSVIIPCYNDKEYIQETISSVLNQTFQDFEVIIVDDGSDVATKKFLSGIHHEKIRLISQENKGLSAARNTGIENAIGDYILTIDSDDTFDSSFLEKAVAVLDANPTVCAVSSYCNIFIDDHKIISLHAPIGGGVDNFLFDNNSVSFALFRKSSWKTIGGYDEQMRKGFEDWEFWIAMTKQCGTVYIIPEYLFNYRQKAVSMSKDTKMFHREANLNYIYKKHQDVYSKKFPEVVDYLTDLAARNKRNEIKFRNSIDFKIGEKLLQPVRFIKHLLKK